MRRWRDPGGFRGYVVVDDAGKVLAELEATGPQDLDQRAGRITPEVLRQGNRAGKIARGLNAGGAARARALNECERLAQRRRSERTREREGGQWA